MNLDELLKVNSVRCIKTKVDENLVEGETYKVEGFNDEAIKIVDRNGFSSWHNKNLFEITSNNMSKSNAEIDISLNSFDDVNRVIPTFKVGDKVYCPSMLDGLIYTVKVNSKYPSEGCKLFVINDHEDCYDFDECGSNQYNNPIVYHATEENHLALQVLHPNIEFELSPKPLTGSDLCRAMLKKWWLYVPCYTSNDSEEACVSSGVIRFIKTVSVVDGTFINNHNHSYKYAVPFDPKTGTPLTEDVLYETI